MYRSSEDKAVAGYQEDQRGCHGVALRDSCAWLSSYAWLSIPGLFLVGILGPVATGSNVYIYLVAVRLGVVLGMELHPFNQDTFARHRVDTVDCTAHDVALLGASRVPIILLLIRVLGPVATSSNVKIFLVAVRLGVVLGMALHPFNRNTFARH